ncbi:hypothetical protein DL93DRAFT_2227764 [Clavulina sp. PMI_390]|nr:hypothetical protein DL93DRAFT_2227764 [Clavulina sp. PMI_390]
MKLTRFSACQVRNRLGVRIQIVNCSTHTTSSLLISGGSGPGDNTQKAPSISSDPISQLISSRKWEDDLAQLCQHVVTARLQLHEAARQNAQTLHRYSPVDEKSCHDWGGISMDPSQDVQTLLSLPPTEFKKILHSLTMSYDRFRRLIAIAHSPLLSDLPKNNLGELNLDIDEWIRVHERKVREVSSDTTNWQDFLVDWSLHAQHVLPSSHVLAHSEAGSSRRELIRETGTPGFSFMDEQRSSSISLQPSFEGFQHTFNKFSDNLFIGLDWSNIFVAGGSVLSSLLCVENRDLSNYIASDIDMYLYGLSPTEANHKVHHIFETWKQNLPPEARQSVFIVRNSRTITFFPPYPYKRLQIVLMAVRTPLDVLLTYDLDVCAMGYDGQRLLMLPKAARALETGYNVLNMDWIEGHYLGRRKPSMPERIFKYAGKGYGVRIPTSYLNGISEQELWKTTSRAAGWTRTVLDLSKASQKSGFDFKSPQYRWLWKAQDWLGGRDFSLGTPFSSNYALMKGGLAAGFEALMRHVELRRAVLQRRIKAYEGLITPRIEDNPEQSYDDATKLYQWDDTFQVDEFEDVLKNVQERATTGFYKNLIRVRSWKDRNAKERSEYLEILEKFIKSTGSSVRVSYGSDLHTVLGKEGDLKLHLFVPAGFARWANNLVQEALRSNSFPNALEEDKVVPIETLETVQLWGSNDAPFSRNDWFDIIQWNITSVLTWQQSDPRIDEVFSMLWALYRIQPAIDMPNEYQAQRLYAEIHRRSIRPSHADDVAAFKRWAIREPSYK